VVVPGGGRRTNSSISLRVIAGASSATPGGQDQDEDRGVGGSHRLGDEERSHREARGRGKGRDEREPVSQQ